MNFIRKFLQKIEPQFNKGAKLEKLYPLFEAMDTFLFTPNDRAKTAPFIRDSIDLKRTMILVVMALIPCLLFGIYNVGHQYSYYNNLNYTFFAKIVEGLKCVLPIYMVVFTVGGLCEVLFSVIRKHEINEGFLVTGFLIPLIMPPSIPLWVVALSTVFGVIIGKEMEELGLIYLIQPEQRVFLHSLLIQPQCLVILYGYGRCLKLMVYLQRLLYYLQQENL
jgi:Na+-transporting NADH:ubiquinone oxidoreductase subunit B